MSVLHVSSLLGSETSSFMQDGQQIGINLIALLVKLFTETVGDNADLYYANVDEKHTSQETLEINLNAEDHSTNLKLLIEVLYSF